MRIQANHSSEAEWILARTVLAVSCWLMLAAVDGRPAAVEKPAGKTVYDYSLVTFDNKEVPLSMFQGKVLVIVNLASQSVFRDQIVLLDELQKTYKDKGLVVIGIPCNDFGAQEPGSNAETQTIYNNDLHLSFPVFARASVRGKDQAALYEFLTSDTKGSTGGDVHWSYTKFVVDRTGKVVARFEPHVTPNSPQLRVTLEDVLAGKFKPPAQTSEGEDHKKETRDRDEGPDR
jgi:glutathione peroxidase